MKDRFSAPQIARRRPTSFANFLRRHHTKNAEESAGKLIALADAALHPQAWRVPSMQKTLAATVDLHACLARNARSLRADAALELARTPYAMLTSIPGIGLVLAAGVAGELGDPGALPRADSLCAYSGIVPRVYQSGGPDSPARQAGTSVRCNRILKDWVVQSSQKIGLYGPPELKDRMTQWQANGQHAAFAGARRYLRLLRTLVRSEVPYLDPSGRGLHASAQARRISCEQTWDVLVKKWRSVPDWRENVFAEDKPLGFWRKVAMEMFEVNLPLGR
jgi:transposase